MKRLLLIAPVLLALSACDGDMTSASTPSPIPQHIETTTVAPPPVEPSVVKPYVDLSDRVDDVMRSVAAERGLDLPAGFGSEYADIVCTGFEDGLSFLMMVQIAADEIPRWGDEDHAFLVGASVGSLCPEYRFVIEGGAA